VKFQVWSDGTFRPLDVPVRRLLIAGFTGRDQAAVAAHVEELAAHGIAGPKRVPSLFAGVPARVTTAPSIVVQGARTSGEAEFIVTRHGGELLVGIGSDHTDRELEAHSIIKSKQVSEKPVGSLLWRASDLDDHWDELQLRAIAWDDGGNEVVYQDGLLTAMMTLPDLVADVEGRVGDITGDVLFSGTLPIATEDFVCGPRFRSELIDPVLRRRLICEYAVEVLPVLDD
jgi:hypothetical protein